MKIYSDAYTQYEALEFLVSHLTQTEPEPERITFTLGTQTPRMPLDSSSVQTDPLPSPAVDKIEMIIQTDTPIEDTSESVASTSTANKTSRDLPPSYSESRKNDLHPDHSEQHEMRIAAEAIRKWHKGIEIPLSPVQGGISEDAIEEWAALKEEMGFECLAIDKVIEMSIKTGRSRSERSTATSESSAPLGRRRNKFYNIYNTFVYGKDERKANADAERPLAAAVTNSAVFLGLCVVAAGVLVGPYMHHQYTIPGGPTYYDRAAWSEFNSLYPVGEGFAHDGAAGVWAFIGRVGGGAARMARGWPT